MEDDYKAAYLRQKLARERAEELLETKSRALFDLNQNLQTAYNQLKDQNSQILHQEKLASIGQLSAGVAHEINNPIAFIKNNFSSLRKYNHATKNCLSLLVTLIKNEGDYEKRSAYEKTLEDNDIYFMMDDLDDIIEESMEGLDRMSEIVKSLKDFSRVDHIEKEVVDINDIIKTVLKLVRSEIKYKAKLETQLCDSAKVHGHAGSLHQVFLNLIVNASQAIKLRGVITIVTEVVEGKIVIKVTDDGEGISPNNLNKIFDPFFSTKEVGEGTGLGLSITHGIVTEHKGEIIATSERGQGTCFQITLPRYGT